MNVEEYSCFLLGFLEATCLFKIIVHHANDIFQIFVSIDQQTTVKEIADILQIDLQQVCSFLWRSLQKFSLDMQATFLTESKNNNELIYNAVWFMILSFIYFSLNCGSMWKQQLPRIRFHVIVKCPDGMQLNTLSNLLWTFHTLNRQRMQYQFTVA